MSAVGCLLLVVACAVPNGVGPATTLPTVAGSTTSDAPSTTRPTPPTTTQPPPSTSMVTTTSTILLPETLDDGRPATFMAVTDDYEAVEVDTATGAVVRSFGQRADAASLASADEIAPNVVDGVWRSASGDTVLISECCEPAAGRITFLSGDETLDDDYEEPAWNGWWVIPSANSDQLIITGYVTEVVDAMEGPSGPGTVALFDNDGSGVGAIGWSPDGSQIHWFDESAGDLVTWTRSERGFEITSRVPIDWVGPDQQVSGLDAQSNGNVVSFLTRHAPDGAPIDTEGVVYSPLTGERLSEFPVPAGSSFGGYDPTGRFLIYTTREGDVTFQGLGRIGVLGEGYVFASW